MINQGEYICDMYYYQRLKELECGLPVRQLSVFMAPGGDSFNYIGANTGLQNVEKIEDLIERFGKPIDIDFASLEVKKDWEEWLCFISDRNLSARELRLLKKSIDDENTL